MDVLEDERESRFATVLAPAPFRYSAPGRIEEEGAVIGFAIVVAGDAKSQGACENQQRGRKGPPVMGWVYERRIKRGEVGSPLVISAFEGTHRERLDLQLSPEAPLRRNRPP